LKEGSFCFLAAPPKNLAKSQGGTISRRLQARCYTTLYRVRQIIPPSSVVLEDPDSGSADLGFAQPVALERVVPFKLQHLERALPDTRQPRLELRTGHASWEECLVVGQSATGKVRLRRCYDATEFVTDLSQEEYRWVDSA
jgi:hypothetical protein